MHVLLKYNVYDKHIIRPKLKYCLFPLSDRLAEIAATEKILSTVPWKDFFFFFEFRRFRIFFMSDLGIVFVLHNTKSSGTYRESSSLSELVIPSVPHVLFTRKHGWVWRHFVCLSRGLRGWKTNHSAISRKKRWE